jgi:glycosyltransferase involved in cell wall biosynthesis
MRVSIITVTKNSEKTIFDTINSVASQTYLDYEHIIVDGGSTDATLKIIEEFRSKNIKLYSEADLGIYDAMNKGINLSRGDIIGFLNSDDFYSTKLSLKKIVSVFDNYDIEVSYSDLIYISPHQAKTVRYWKSRDFMIGDFGIGWSPPHPTFYIKRSSIERCRKYFNLEYKLAADIEFMSYYLEVIQVKSFYIPEVLVTMRTGGVTNNSFINIIKQNHEIIRGFKKNNIHFSLPKFLNNKIVDRLRQKRNASFCHSQYREQED